ncbi:Phosphopantetheine attachment site [Acetomicrobium flavidum]|uniref:Phosphopantetheine attachment site n=1 Tax=Acetomicrobium flavidum TaxID=49896 RepID=A0ABY1JBQ7_9BACT|nr:Phosphopantetheine attachment site [Acetomicrobium flavidum]
MNSLKQILSDILKVDLENYPDEKISAAFIESWDSFALLNMVIVIEEEYGIKIDPSEIMEMNNGYLSMVNVLKRHGVAI